MQAPKPIKERLVVITGTSGAVGREYVESFSKIPNISVLSISRRPVAPIEGVTHVQVDLFNAKAVSSAIEEIALENVKEVIFVHPVGKFKFEPDGKPAEDENSDGIDDELYKSNVDTFLNLTRPLLKRIRTQRNKGNKISLTLCGLGSVSDKFEVPYWSSYTKTKNILRSLLYNLSQEYPEYCRGLFVNVSTVDTENENELRPAADKTYWLKPSEIILASVPYLFGARLGSWKQLDVFKQSPFFQEGYYENVEEIRRAWETQMKTDAEHALEQLSHEVLAEVQTELTDEFKGVSRSIKFPFR